MRRVRRGAAAIAGAILVASVVAAATLLAIHAAAPNPRAASDDRVPLDLSWMWVRECLPDGGVGWLVVSGMQDSEGVATVQLVPFDGTQPEFDENGDVVVDAQTTAEVNACLAQRTFEPFRSDRQARPAERLLLVGWVAGWEAPCLRARGFDVETPAVAALLDEQQVSWFLLDQQDWAVDFDTLLAARRACAPVPPFLADRGVGW